MKVVVIFLLLLGYINIFPYIYIKRNNMNITKICEHCGNEFTIPFKQRNKKYCNRTCYVAAGIKGKPKQLELYEDRNCLYCGKTFNIRKKQENKLCSDECRKAWNLIPENKENRINNSKSVLIEKYGVDSIFKTTKGQESAKRGMLKKYGVESPMHVKEFVDKLKLTFKENHMPKLTENLKLGNLTLLDEYVTNKDGNTSKPYRFKCTKCNNIFTSTLLGCGKIPICRKCYPLVKNSVIERSINDFLNEKNINFINNDKKILNGKEIDFYIKEKHIGFEVNGNYWHSEIYGEKNRQYHINKSKLANEKNIKLIHIFEDEIKLHPEIVESRISNILGLINNKIFARKCEIREVLKKDSIVFLNNNHLQGNSVDKFRYGLYYNNELVSIMTFGAKRKSLGNKNVNENEFELLRFCNKINITVNGGFSRLLNHFIKIYKPKNIITFADIRWSGIKPENTVYMKNGFNFVGISPPNYWYVNVGSFLNRYHRFQFRKDVLVKAGYSADKTEWEIMQEKGYDRIWDCGNMKFEMNF